VRAVRALIFTIAEPRSRGRHEAITCTSIRPIPHLLTLVTFLLAQRRAYVLLMYSSLRDFN